MLREEQYRTLRKVRMSDIEPGEILADKIVDSWDTLSQEPFMLDGFRVDRVLVTFYDNTDEEMILIRNG